MEHIGIAISAMDGIVTGAPSPALPELGAPVRKIRSGVLPASVILASNTDEAVRPNWSSRASDGLLEHKSGM